MRRMTRSCVYFLDSAFGTSHITFGTKSGMRLSSRIALACYSAARRTSQITHVSMNGVRRSTIIVRAAADGVSGTARSLRPPPKVVFRTASQLQAEKEPIFGTENSPRTRPEGACRDENTPRTRGKESVRTQTGSLGEESGPSGSWDSCRREQGRGQGRSVTRRDPRPAARRGRFSEASSPCQGFKTNVRFQQAFADGA